MYLCMISPDFEVLVGLLHVLVCTIVDVFMPTCISHVYSIALHVHEWYMFIVGELSGQPLW